MSFTRVNPPGWGVGDKFKSTQANALDIDHANALDKTTAGDTLSGVVTLIGATASLVCPGPGPGNVGSIQCTGGNAIISYAAGGIYSASANGITTGVAGGISCTAAGGITTTVAGGIASGVAGGIALTGGSTDWPTFGGTNRTRSVVAPCTGALITPSNTATASNALTQTFGGAGSYVAGGLVVQQVSTSSNTTAYGFLVPLLGLHNGATLATATLWVTGSAAHTALPSSGGGQMPRFGIFCTDNQGNTGPLLTTGSGFVADTSSTLLGYATPHGVTLTTNTLNVINTAIYKYFAVILDECSTANATTGNRYDQITLGYTTIPNMAFP